MLKGPPRKILSDTTNIPPHSYSPATPLYKVPPAAYKPPPPTTPANLQNGKPPAETPKINGVRKAGTPGRPTYNNPQTPYYNSQTPIYNDATPVSNHIDVATPVANYNARNGVPLLNLATPVATHETEDYSSEVFENVESLDTNYVTPRDRDNCIPKEICFLILFDK